MAITVTKIWPLILTAGLLLGCSPDGNGSDAEAVEVEGPVASAIRHPLAGSVDGELADTANVARISFPEVEYLFGEVDEGSVLEHDFIFTNTGTAPLLISDVRSTCGCTVTTFPKDPIPPGGGGVIEATFNTAHKYGRQRKPITVIANTYPSLTTIYMDGTIIND